jgi:hypothetical protein
MNKQLNPTATLSLRAMPATVAELMLVTRRSRGAVRHAIKLLQEEKLIYISAYRVNVGCHSPIYKAGSLPDAKKVDKKVADRARHRRYYLKQCAKKKGLPITQWQPMERAA